MIDIARELMSLINKDMITLKDNIIVNSMNAGQEATGKTYASMQIIEEDILSNTLIGRPDFQNLETGVLPGTSVNVESLLKWAKAKGVMGNIKRMAARIEAKGSRLFRAGGRTDIFTNEIEQLYKDLPEKLAQKLIISVGFNVGANEN